MKRNLFVFLAAVSLLAGGRCSTQSQSETQVKTEGAATEIKQTGPGENIKTITVTGVVTKYDAGNEIEIQAADGNSHDFDLEDDVRIEGTIEIGKPATVAYTDQGGVKRVTIVTSGTPSS